MRADTSLQLGADMRTPVTAFAAVRRRVHFARPITSLSFARALCCRGGEERRAAKRANGHVGPSFARPSACIPAQRKVRIEVKMNDFS